jgi:uncharacterized protein YkwD
MVRARPSPPPPTATTWIWKDLPLTSPSSRRATPLAVAAAIGCALSLLGAPAAFAAGACESANATPSLAGERQLVRATLCLLSAERASAALPPLRLEPRLAQAARRHAADMARKRYFDHDSLDGSSFLERIRRAGYLSGAVSWRAGENIAWGSGWRSTPRSVTRAWMRSKGHRANILSPRFRHIGIGVARGAPLGGVSGPAAVYVTDFGSRR